MSKYSFTEEDDALLKELGIVFENKPKSDLTKVEERVIDGFREIVRFCEENGRIPTIDDGENLLEKRYAVRLGRIKQSGDFRILLKEYDKFGLLEIDDPDVHQIESLSDDELLDKLGIDASSTKAITNLMFVKSKVTIDAADQIASRTPSPDFGKFKPLFLRVKEDLKQGLRQSKKYKDDATILPGDLFILGGQIAYVAEMGPEFTNTYGRQDSRMKVVFDNGTHTEGMLMRSFQRALNKDGNARRIEPLAVVPLFAEDFEDGDLESGTIYVLRSKSKHPLVLEHYDIVHKIGVTGGDVAKRIANAKYDSTFLMADVEIVAEYRLANINRIKLESLIHRFFSQVQLDIQVQDRFGKTVTVKEWFLAPLFVIDQMIMKLRSDRLSEYYYDKDTASIERIAS